MHAVFSHIFEVVNNTLCRDYMFPSSCFSLFVLVSIFHTLNALLKYLVLLCCLYVFKMRQGKLFGNSVPRRTLGLSERLFESSGDGAGTFSP